MTLADHVALALCTQWVAMKDRPMPCSEREALLLGRAAAKAVARYVDPKRIAKLETIVEKKL